MAAATGRVRLNLTLVFITSCVLVLLGVWALVLAATSLSYPLEGATLPSLIVGKEPNTGQVRYGGRTEGHLAAGCKAVNIGGASGCVF